MAAIQLADHQIQAIRKMHNGCILNGSVGSGKSRTALAYYYILQGGRTDGGEKYVRMQNPIDLYIITTAKKRDDFEWESEMAPFLLSTHQDCNAYQNQVTVDSWNNISKYVSVQNSFFIFDDAFIVTFFAILSNAFFPILFFVSFVVFMVTVFNLLHP